MYRNLTLITVLLAVSLLFSQAASAASGPTATPIFADGFESGNLSAWDFRQTDGGDLLATPQAALEGSWGMRVLIDDNTPIYVVDDTPNAEVSYKAKFRFDPNSIAMGSGDFHTIFLGHDMAPSNRPALRIEFRRLGGTYYLRASARLDNLTWLTTAWFTITDQSHEVEVEWDAAESAAVHDGQLKFFIDSVLKANRTGLDNDSFQIDRARLGALANLDTTTRGRYFMDSFESFQ